MAMKIAAKWLFILCLPVLLLTATISWVANSLWLYQYGAREYGVRQDLADAGLELSDAELEVVYASLINYFNSGEEYISLTVTGVDKTVDLFTREEVIHFQDVKRLIWLVYWVLLGTLIYALAYAGFSIFWWHDRRRLAWGLVGGSCLTLALMLALVLLNTLFGFDELFYQFHLLFFSNEFWSAQGYMLRLFPEGYFYDVTAFGALAIAVGAVILGGVGWWLKRGGSAP